MSGSCRVAFRKCGWGLICLIASVFSLSSAQAQSDTAPVDIQNVRAFGHHIQLNTYDNEVSISVDGKELKRGHFLGIDRFLKINGVGVILGFLNDGSAVCESARFFISFPKHRAPLFQETPCGDPSLKISKSAIVLETEASLGSPGERWRWTPEKGLKLEAGTPFVATRNGGWAALKAGKIRHPADFMDYRDLGRRVRETVSRDWKKVLPAITGPGGMEYKGDLAIGTACERHLCGDRQVLVIADLPQRRLYLGLWLSAKGKVFSYPSDPKTWSREAYEAWRSWAQVPEEKAP